MVTGKLGRAWHRCMALVLLDVGVVGLVRLGYYRQIISNSERPIL